MGVGGVGCGAGVILCRLAVDGRACAVEGRFRFSPISRYFPGRRSLQNSERANGLAIGRWAPSERGGDADGGGGGKSV